MIHELRIYTCLPRRLPALQERLKNAVLPIWDAIGIRPIGFWTTMIGPDSNQLTYLLEWESLEERERKWSAFVATPEWRKAKADSERDGPIVANIASSILQPTSFFRMPAASVA
jgi:hypothetical protein